MPFDSWGAYVYCFEHKSELLKVTQNSNSRFEVKLTIPAVFLYLFKLEQEKERWLESSSNKDEAKAVLAHKLVDLLLQQGVISDRVAEGGTLNLPKQPTMPPKVWKSSFPTSGHGGKLKATRDQRLRLRASQEDGEDGVKLFILEETWGLATTLPAEHSYQLTLDDTEFRLEVTSAEWTNEHVDVVLKFNLEVLGSGDFEVLLVKVKDGKIDLDAMKVRKADDRPPPQVRDLMHKMDRLSWWELVRKKAPVVPAACPLKLHKIFDEPQAHEKQEFQEDVYCMAKLGKDCLRLMAAVTEYDRLSKAKDSKARDALLKKVEDYLDPERIADLMAFASSSASWPNDATHGRHNRAWLRFWVWSFLTSKTYAGDDPRRSWILWLSASFYQFIMASAVVFLLVLDSTTDVTVTTDEYWIAELVLTCVWSVEYFLRLWSCVEGEPHVPKSGWRRCRVRVRCALHPLMLVDLVSLVSLLVDLSIDSNELRGLGALRMLRVFTLLRLERDWQICDPLLNVVVKEARLLGGAVAIALTMLVCCSVVMFYVEAPSNPKFGTVADCLWWGTTALTTVGYGDLYPESPLGRVVASITAFLGIGLFALPAGIITSGFRDEQERKYHRIVQIVNENNDEGQQDAAEMFFALLGAHKLESDMFTLIRLWEWFVADEHNKCERSLDPAKKYTAGCPRYLGRTPSYMEFGEVDPKDGSALHLKVRFEDCDDAFYRWNGPNAEELRPGLYDGKREWRPCPWDPILGTFCSPSMKLSNGDPRPLPNKVSAWLRGRSMKKLVSIKHSMESTPPYFYLREEEHETDKVEQLIVVYRKIGEVCYRRSAHGGLGEEIYEGQVYPLSFSENKKTLVSQAMPGWALPRKVVTWLLEKRSLPDLIPGRKKSASDQISTQEKKAGFMTSRNEKVWVEAKALTSGRGHIFQVEEGGMWKALSYSEEKKEWVFNVRKAQEEEIVPCEAIAYIYEKIDDSAKLNTPTVRRYFPEASGTAVAEIEQQTDHRFYELSLLAEALTHCSAGSSIVKPNDHLAFVGEAALKCFVSEKAIAEVAFNAHLVVKEGSVSGKTFCAPASFTLPKKELKSPESESKSPKSDKGDSSPPLSLKETLKRRRLACCNHVSYASSCVKNELHKNINHTSEQLKESISIFAKKQAKGKVAALVKLGAPKVLGDTQLATIGSITMDSDNLEAESLMAKHYKESNDTFYKELLQDAEIPHFSKFSFEDGKSMQDTLKALDHDMVKDQISLAPWLLSADPEVDRNEINKLKYCTDLMLLEVENPKGENELIACSSPRAMLLNVALQRRQEGGSSDEDAGEQNEGSGDQDAGQSESDRRPTETLAIYCKPCKMWLNGPTQWADHEIGKKHRKAVRRQQAAKHAGCEEEDEQPRPIPAEFGKGPRKDERSEAEQGEGAATRGIFRLL
ncbi:unnamed protein product [Effrenium voratum]|nr:unnamed protein product [Effrenium voratum]